MGWLSKGAGGKAPQGRKMPARGIRGTSILSVSLLGDGGAWSSRAMVTNIQLDSVCSKKKQWLTCDGVMLPLVTHVLYFIHGIPIFLYLALTFPPAAAPRAAEQPPVAV